MRSCKQSQWHLHRGSDYLTAGRYWFCPAETPHYPGLHNLGSRAWMKGAELERPALGEYDGPEAWDDGAPPNPLPLPLLVGTPSCIEIGERLPDPPFELRPAFTSQNYPRACWGQDQPQEIAFDVQECNTFVPFADCLTRLYLDDVDAREFLRARLPAEYSLFSVPNTASFVPGTVIAVGPKVLVVIAGTTTPQQLALQILYLAHAMTNFGAYNTLRVNQAAAIAIEDRMRAAGATSDLDTWLIGHSYGGAIAQVIAARILLGRPNARVRLLTYGSPAAGDVRLRNYLQASPQRHFANNDDPVPGLPVAGASLVELAGILAPALFAKWNILRHARNRTVVFGDGTLEDQDENFLGPALEITMANLIAAAIDPQPFSAHFMGTYLARLQIACDPAVLPRPQIAWRIQVANLTYRVNGIDWNFSDDETTGHGDGPDWFKAGPPPQFLVHVLFDDNGNWNAFEIFYNPLSLGFSDPIFRWTFSAAKCVASLTTQVFPQLDDYTEFLGYEMISLGSFSLTYIPP